MCYIINQTKLKGDENVTVMALGSAQVAKFMIIVILMFAGIFIIAVVTPRLAAFIDKKRGKAPDYSQVPKAPISPFESAPLPERVEESTDLKDGSKPDTADSPKVEDNLDSEDNPAPGADISPKNEDK